MLTTIEAQIAFGVWILFQAIMFFGIRKMLNGAGMIFSLSSITVVLYLLYTQNWTIFFWYTVIIGMVTPFLRMMWKENYHEKLTIPIYIFTVLFVYVINLGSYGIIYWLNM